MIGAANAGLRRRRRLDRVFGLVIRTVSVLPALMVILLLFSLIDRSLGSIAVSEGEVVGQWNLLPTVFASGRIRSDAAGLGPEVTVRFRSWLSVPFLLSVPSSSTADSGLMAAIAGSLWILGIGLLVAFPVALATALWASISRTGALHGRILDFILGTYRRIPHVLYGICALALFSTILRLLPGFAGLRSLGSAGLLMALILLPRMTLMMKQEMDVVSPEVLQASFALGADRPTVAFRQLLPASMSMILARTISIAVGVLGLASPFIVLGPASFVTSVPAGLDERFTTVPVQIFQWSLRPEGAYRSLAAAAALFLLTVIFLLNLVSYMWRRRILRRREGLR